MRINRGIIALSPLMLFIVLYLVTSIVVGDFYKVPITAAFMISSAYGIIISRGATLNKRIRIFSRGAGNHQMMLMLWIFVLAGGFANSAKVMGSIDATVNLMLTLLPANMLLAGLFLAACFISLSIGSAFGTVVALAPIASGLAASTDANAAMMVAIIVGGSFFGDNLSFISDTTIAATTTQECKMSDKFRANSYIVFPAALLIFIVYIFVGLDMSSPHEIPELQLLKVVPYLIVLVTAVCGMNVLAVLALGILFTGIIGIADGSFDVFGWLGAIGAGIVSMGELIIITMMAGGMLELIKVNGGISYLIRNMTKHVSGSRGAELTIAGLVTIATICTANNTVAIITTGNIARQISLRFGVDNRKSASILDTMSCFTQGLLPFGAHLLFSSAIAGVNPIALIPYLYYPLCIGVFAILAIIFRYPRKYSGAPKHTP